MPLSGIALLRLTAAAQPELQTVIFGSLLIVADVSMQTHSSLRALHLLHANQDLT